MPNDQIEDIRAAVLKLLEWEKRKYVRNEAQTENTEVWADKWCLFKNSQLKTLFETKNAEQRYKSSIFIFLRILS